MRHGCPANQAAGDRVCAGLVRHGAAIVVLAVLAFVVSAAAAPLDDLLFDLQFAPLDGTPAPPFTLAALDGKPVSLARLKDRVVLLYFWASW